MRETRSSTPSLATELVQLKVDVLVLGPLPAIRAAKQATKTIPIVFVTTQDPVAAGFVESLARPGGNIPGLTRLHPGASREAAGIAQAGGAGDIARRSACECDAVEELSGGTANDFQSYEAPARALKIQLQPLAVREPNPDFEGALQAAAKGRASALITVSGALFNSHLKRIIDLAIRNRLPSIHKREGLRRGRWLHGLFSR